MRIAFHSPLKPLDHSVPSGDRAMARSLFRLLNDLGHDVFVASRLRTYDRDGAARRQQRIADVGRWTSKKLVDRWTRDPSLRPDLWFTYHLYHKAPDHLGPHVSRYLDIPYLVVEASIAPKQLGGLWSLGYASAAEAIAAADLLLSMTDRDRRALLDFRGDAQAVELFPPFIDTRLLAPSVGTRVEQRSVLARSLGLDAEVPWLLAVGMMRDDAKRRSFELILHTLRSMTDRNWQMLLVGDGSARSDLEALAASLYLGSVNFLGQRSSEDLASIYRSADLYFWPAVDEAYGLAIMEAEAAGLAVVVGREGGVPEIVEHGKTGLLVDSRQIEGFRCAIVSLLEQPERRSAMGAAAASLMRREFDTSIARKRMTAAIERALQRHECRGHALP